MCLNFTQAQTYYDKYNLVVASPFYKNISTNENYINKIDTIDLSNNKGLSVMVSTVNAYYNQDYCFIEIFIRKSNVNAFINEKNYTCLIDYKKNIVYDNSLSSIISYNLPPNDSIIIDSISCINDSIAFSRFNFNNKIIEVKTEKKIPKEIRGFILSTDNKWGVSYTKTQDKLIELIDFKLIDFNFTEKLKEVKKNCTNPMQGKYRLIL